jgi:ribose transport system substrate-binding protein
MKKALVFLVVIALALAITGMAFAGGGAEKKAAGKSFKIGYSQFWGTNPFLIAMTNGANKAIEEWKAKGVETKMIVTNGGDTDTSKQVADTEDLFSQKVNGLLIFPGDSILLSEPVKNLYNKNNIPVVVTDIGLQSGKYISFLITDNYLGGKQLADLVAKNVSKGSKVATFQHAPGNMNAITRQSGFEERAKELGLLVLPAKKLKLSLEDGKTTMEDTLASDPDIAAVFLINQVVAQGAVSALEAAGNTKCKVVTFDIDKPSLDLVKRGKILGITVQDPWLIGREGMNQMLSYLTGGTPKAKFDVPPKLCTKENASDFDNDPQVSGK